MEAEPAQKEPAADSAKATEPQEPPPTPAKDESTPNKPTPDKPAANEPAKDKPAPDKPAANEPAKDKPAPDKPAANEPTKDKPAPDKPAENEPAKDDAGTEPVADGATDDPTVVIKAVRTEGELCPQDSILASVSSDEAAATIAFSVAEVRSGAEGGCKVVLDLELTPGYQFSRLRLHSQGYLFAEEAGTSLEVTGSFRGSDEQQRFVHEKRSGDESYLFSDTFDSLWSPCDAANSQQSVALAFDLVARAAPDGYFSISTLDLDFAATDGIRWRSCETP